MKNSPFSRKNKGYPTAYEQGMNHVLKRVLGVLVFLVGRIKAVVYFRKM